MFHVDMTGRKEQRDSFFAGMGIPEPSKFIPDEFQKEAVRLSTGGHDTLVVAPTGSGKTFIATQAIEATLELGQRAVYTTPLKALSNTKYTEFKARFEPKFRVGLLTGDRKIEGDAHVVVATTEIYRNELYRGDGRFSLVVLDEVHFIGDQQRGAVWEEAIILTPSSATLLMLSASISNSKEIAEWISHVRGKECEIVTKTERSVPLRYGFIHPELGIIPLETSEGKINRDVIQFYGEGRRENRRRRR